MNKEVRKKSKTREKLPLISKEAYTGKRSRIEQKQLKKKILQEVESLKKMRKR